MIQFTTVEEVKPLIKGRVNPEKETYIQKKIDSTSIKLLARFRNLAVAWNEAEGDPNSILRPFVVSMVEGAVAKLVNNPDGFSSETMGPFAYSKFDSEDPLKGLFEYDDVKALEELLANDKQAGNIRMSADIRPAAPITHFGRKLIWDRRRFR